MKRSAKLQSSEDKQNFILHNIFIQPKESSKRRLKSIEIKKEYQKQKQDERKIKHNDRYFKQQQNMYVNTSLGDTIQLPTFGDWKSQLKIHSHRPTCNYTTLNIRKTVNHNLNTSNYPYESLNCKSIDNNQNLIPSQNLNILNKNSKHHKNKRSSIVKLQSIQLPAKTTNTDQKQKQKQKQKQRQENNKQKRIKIYEQQTFKRMPVCNDPQSKNKALNPIDLNANVAPNKQILISPLQTESTNTKLTKSPGSSNKKSNQPLKQNILDQKNPLMPKYRRRSVSIQQSLTSKAKALSREVQINFETIDQDLNKIINRKEIFRNLYTKQKQKYEEILRRYNIDEKVDDAQFHEYFK